MNMYLYIYRYIYIYIYIYILYCMGSKGNWSNHRSNPIGCSGRLSALSSFGRLSFWGCRGNWATLATLGGLCLLRRLALGSLQPLKFLTPISWVALALVLLALIALLNVQLQIFGKLPARNLFFSRFDFTGFTIERKQGWIFWPSMSCMWKGLAVFQFLACSGLPTECRLCTLEAACREYVNVTMQRKSYNYLRWSLYIQTPERFST